MPSRKKFLQQSSFGLLSFLFLPDTMLAAATDSDFKGIVVMDEEGEAYQWRDGTARVKIKIAKDNGAGSLSFLSESFIPGDAIRVHKHSNEDELIFIHKGSGVFTLDEKEYPVQAGAVALVPKGIWHGLRNTGAENIEMRFAYAPSGFEGYFRALGTPLGQSFIPRSPEERKAVELKYGLIRKS